MKFERKYTLANVPMHKLLVLHFQLLNMCLMQQLMSQEISFYGWLVKMYFDLVVSSMLNFHLPTILLQKIILKKQRNKQKSKGKNLRQ